MCCGLDSGVFNPRQIVCYACLDSYDYNRCYSIILCDKWFYRLRGHNCFFERLDSRLSFFVVCMRPLMHVARGLRMRCNDNNQEDWIEIKEPLVLFSFVRR